MTPLRPQVFVAVLKRDLLLAARHRSELANPMVFYLIVATLFPFATGTEPATLRELAPAVIWVAALLASTLSLERMFHSDFEDGSLEQFLLSDQPLTLLVGAKILAHWLLSGIPLVLTALLLALMYRLPVHVLGPLLATLLLGTPILSLLGSVLAALTVGLRGSGVLLALLILPLCIPMLIFAVSAVNNAARGLSISAELYFLAALLVLSLTIMPAAAAGALRVRLA
jgi:heme exporter protein B